MTSFQQYYLHCEYNAHSFPSHSTPLGSCVHETS